MADSKSDASSGKDVKAPNVFERMKDEFEAVVHNEKEKHKHHHHRETHGLNDDIDGDTKISDVKAPNVFERPKEEFEAIVEAIHPKKEVVKTRDSSLDAETRDSSDKGLEKSESHSGKVKEETDPQAHKDKPHHHHRHKETHGLSDDIDENTPISEVRGPSVFERAKEEMEALIQTIHPKKEHSSDAAAVSTHKKKKEGGLPVAIGKGLEKLCSPRGHNKD